MKQRFVMLDGLRGVAAVAVVFYHLSTSFGITHYLPNGPLAVDFFFCLSGFVLASAHGEQFAEGVLGLRRFMLLRVIRVGPMVLLGTILGAISLPWLMTDWAPPRDLRATTTFLSFLTLPSIRAARCSGSMPSSGRCLPSSSSTRSTARSAAASRTSSWRCSSRRWA